jgi:predicted MPP superfamily phosphohydrolase
MAERPDVVFLTGDYVTSHGEQWGPACADALAIVASAPLGAFAVLGNHDWWSDSQEIIQRELARIGVVTLANSAARLRPAGNVWAVGVETLATGQEDVGVAAARTPGGAVRFLLVHEPDFADRVRVPIAMQFSGHSHGGQVRIPGLPSWTPAGARRYVAGLYRSAPHPLFVTRGVGVIGPPVRFRCPPEVAVIEVVPERRGAAVGTGPSAAA